MKKQHQPKASKKQPSSSPNSNFWEQIAAIPFNLGLLCLLLLALILFGFRNYYFGDLLFLFSDQISSDLLNIYYPNMVAGARRFWEEGMTNWSFYKGMGQMIPSGVHLHPSTWMYQIAGPNNVAYIIPFIAGLKMFLVGLLFFVYIQTRKQGTYVAVVGGILAAFFGYLVLGTSWPAHSKNILNFMVLIVAFELLFEKKQWWWLPLAFFLLRVPNLLFSGFFLAVYAAFRFLTTKGWQWKEGGLLIAKMLGLALLGLAMSAPGMAGSAANLFSGPRLSGNTSYTEELSAVPIFSLESVEHYMTAILRFFSNDILGTSSNFQGWYNYLEAPVFYCGLITLLLVPQLFTFLSRREKWWHGGLLFFWLLFIIFPWARYAFFGFHGNYYKHAFSLFIPFTMLFFAMKALYFIQKEGKVNRKVLIGSLVVLLVLLYFPYLSSEQMQTAIDRPLQLVIAIFLLLHAAILWLWSIPKWRTIMPSVLLLLVVIEAGWMANITLNNREAITKTTFNSPVGYNDYTNEAIAHLKSIDPSFYRVVKLYSSNLTPNITLNDAMVQNYYGTTSYSSHNQINYIRFLQEMGEVSTTDEKSTRYSRGLRRKVLLQGFGSCKYMLNKGETRDFDPNLYTEIAAVGDVQIYEVNTYLPFGFTYDQYINAADLQAIKDYNWRHLALYKGAILDANIQPFFNTLTRYNVQNLPASINLNVINQGVTERRRNSFKMEHFEQDHITGTISTQKNELLFFSIPYDRGWQAKVNGQEAEVYPVNVGFMGIPLPPGNHQIELEFFPPLFYPSWVVLVLGFLVYGYLIYRYVWYKKR